MTRTEAVKLGLVDLFDKVDNLENTEKAKVPEILREIEELLLRDYIIELDDIIIKPLWVEAYYYDEENYPDCNTHMSKKQKNRFGKLYFHESGRGGFDICLSKGNYYLSFLMKATTINGAFTKQTGILSEYPSRDAQNAAEERAKLVKKPSATATEIVYLQRRNLSRPCFCKDYIGAITIDSLIERKYAFDFPSGYKQQWQCAIAAALVGEGENKAKEYNNNSKVEASIWHKACIDAEEAKKNGVFCVSFGEYAEQED